MAIYETSDLIPTPTVTDASLGKRKSTQQKPDSKHSVTLKNVMELLPTPTGTDYKSRGPNSKQVGIDNFLKLLPTPRAGNPGSRPNGKGGKILAEEIIKLTSSREVSPASLFPKQESGEARKMTATSGRKCYALYENFIPGGSSVKMLAALLLGATEWYSTKCVLTWKKRDTKCNRLLFQLAPSVRPIGEIGSGLLRTPRVADTESVPVKNAEFNGKGWSRKNKDGVRHGIKIKDAIEFLGTPTTRDWKDTGKMENVPENGLLGRQIGKPTGGRLRLQPAMCEWMMNYPLDWTSLATPKPVIESSDLKPSETQ
jgi:hypothetical protein